MAISMQANFGNFNPAQFQQNADQRYEKIGNRFADAVSALPNAYREGKQWQDDQTAAAVAREKAREQEAAIERQKQDVYTKVFAFGKELSGGSGNAFSNLRPPMKGESLENYVEHVGNEINRLIKDNPGSADKLQQAAQTYAAGDGQAAPAATSATPAPATTSTPAATPAPAATSTPAATPAPAATPEGSVKSMNARDLYNDYYDTKINDLEKKIALEQVRVDTHSNNPKSTAAKESKNRLKELQEMWDAAKLEKIGITSAAEAAKSKAEENDKNRQASKTIATLKNNRPPQNKTKDDTDMAIARIDDYRKEKINAQNKYNDATISNTKTHTSKANKKRNDENLANVRDSTIKDANDMITGNILHLVNSKDATAQKWVSTRQGFIKSHFETLVTDAFKSRYASSNEPITDDALSVARTLPAVANINIDIDDPDSPPDALPNNPYFNLMLDTVSELIKKHNASVPPAKGKRGKK